jgi:hypothetical protein
MSTLLAPAYLGEATMSTASNGTDYGQLLSSFYGPGAFTCWYLIILGVLLTWTIHPQRQRLKSIDVDFAAVLIYPTLATINTFLLPRLLKRRPPLNLNIHADQLNLTHGDFLQEYPALDAWLEWQQASAAIYRQNLPLRDSIQAAHLVISNSGLTAFPFLEVATGYRWPWRRVFSLLPIVLWAIDKFPRHYIPPSWSSLWPKLVITIGGDVTVLCFVALCWLLWPVPGILMRHFNPRSAHYDQKTSDNSQQAQAAGREKETDLENPEKSPSIDHDTSDKSECHQTAGHESTMDLGYSIWRVWLRFLGIPLVILPLGMFGSLIAARVSMLIPANDLSTQFLQMVRGIFLPAMAVPITDRDQIAAVLAGTAVLGFRVYSIWKARANGRIYLP